MSALFGPHPVTLSTQQKWYLGIDFKHWIPDGVTIDSTDVTWTDVDTGADVSSYQEGQTRISNTRIIVDKGSNRGTAGQRVYVTLLGTLSDGNSVGGDGVGTLLLEFQQNN